MSTPAGRSVQISDGYASEGRGSRHQHVGSMGSNSDAPSSSYSSPIPNSNSSNRGLLLSANSSDPNNMIRSLKSRVVELETSQVKEDARQTRIVQESDKMLAELISSRKNVDILTENVETLKALAVRLATDLETTRQQLAYNDEKAQVDLAKRERDMIGELSTLRIDYERRLIEQGRELEKSVALNQELQDALQKKQDEMVGLLSVKKGETDSLVAELRKQNEQLELQLRQALQARAEGLKQKQQAEQFFASPATSGRSRSKTSGNRGAGRNSVAVSTRIDATPWSGTDVEGSTGGRSMPAARSTSNGNAQLQVLALTVACSADTIRTWADRIPSPSVNSVRSRGGAEEEGSGVAPPRFHIDVAADPTVLRRVTEAESHSSLPARFAPVDHDADLDSDEATVSRFFNNRSAAHHRTGDASRWSPPSPSRTASPASVFGSPSYSVADSLAIQSWCFETLGKGIRVRLTAQVTKGSDA